MDIFQSLVNPISIFHDTKILRVVPTVQQTPSTLDTVVFHPNIYRCYTVHLDQHHRVSRRHTVPNQRRPISRVCIQTRRFRIGFPSHFLHVIQPTAISEFSIDPKFPTENATPPEAQQVRPSQPRPSLSRALNHAHNDSIHSVCSTNGSFSAVKACIGP